MSSTAAEKARAFAALTAKKRQADADLKTINVELSGMESDLIDSLLEEGIAKISVDVPGEGTWTISASTLAWAKVKPEHAHELPAILEGTGLLDLLTINSTKLSGLYREHVDVKEHGGEILPDCFVEMLEINERTKVSARRV